MCILAGLLLTLAKKWHCVLYIDELWECVEQMQTYHEHYLLQGEWFVRRMRRQNLQERMLQDASKLLATLLASCLMVNVRIYGILVQEFTIFEDGLRLIFYSTQCSLGTLFQRRNAYPACHLSLQHGHHAWLRVCVRLSGLSDRLRTVQHGADRLYRRASAQPDGATVLHAAQTVRADRGRSSAAPRGPPPRRPVDTGPGVQCDSFTPAVAVVSIGKTRMSLALFSTPERPLLFTGSFCNRLKRLYEPNIMAQFVCSMLIICLTAFELMFAKGDPMQMVRFGAYMLAGFYQVFVWSFFGNRVTNMSTGISDATISCNWIVLADGLKKDLRFTTMRSQKPFVIDVYWLFPLTYETFIAILSRSYSIFTLLRTMIE
ncbi:AGAP005760-PB [Anopheles gambiae str. PEST]|nr:AGAP005760-PB [Anopheles gambiae str. PEST]